MSDLEQAENNEAKFAVKMAELREIVNHQAEMKSLWFNYPKTIREALLASALRHLHATIEDHIDTANFCKEQYWGADEL